LWTVIPEQYLVATSQLKTFPTWRRYL